MFKISRYGITTRMFAGLTLMMVFTLIVSAIAIKTFRGFQDSFDFVVDEGLPTIIAASDIGQHSATLVAFAPSLLAARTQQSRETILLQIRDQDALMARSIGKLNQVGISADKVQRLSVYRSELGSSFKELGELVALRIKRDALRLQGLKNLTQLQTKIAAQITTMQLSISRAAPQNLARLQQRAQQKQQLQEWSSQLQGLISLIQQSAFIEHQVVLRRQIAEYQKKWQQLQSLTAELAKHSEARLNLQLQLVENLVMGDQGIINNLLGRFSDEDKLYGMFGHHRSVSHRFRAAISAIIHDIEDRVVAQSKSIELQLSERIGQLVIVSLLCIAGGGMIFLYIDKSVISRLQRLKNTMYAHVKGQKQPIELEGNDEITDMAQALRVFVQTIADREQALKSARNQAQQAEDLLMDAIESTSEGFVLFDAQDRLILSNRQFQTMYGYPQSLLQAGTELQQLMNWLLVNKKVVEPQDYAEQRLALRAGEISSLDLKLENGTWISLIERRTDSDGTVGVHALINARKLAEQVLRDAMEKAEAADRAKSKFLAAASHDLRQPLHAMGLFLDELLEHAREQSFEKLVSDISSAHLNMSEMFDDILDLSRLESGAFKAQLQHFSLHNMLQRLAQEFAITASDKGLTLRSVSSSMVVYSDPLMLERILRNLISNAVRYTDEGSILIGVRGRGKYLQIQVWDTGIGIAEDQQQRIFKEFYQGRVAQQQGRKGLGLGLAITEHLARLLQINIQLCSQLGRGSCFSLRVAQGDVEQVKSTVVNPLLADPSPLREQRIVLVENDPQVLLATSQMLSRWGCEVLAYEALAEIPLAELAEPGQPKILALISDFHLDGEETAVTVIESVRNALQTDIAAIIISGDSSGEPRLAAQQVQAKLLTKPVRPGKLAALLRQIQRSQKSVR